MLLLHCNLQVEDGYNELLKVLKNNPPYIESHVKALEIEVRRCCKQTIAKIFKVVGVMISHFRTLFIYIFYFTYFSGATGAETVWGYVWASKCLVPLHWDGQRQQGNFFGSCNRKSLLMWWCSRRSPSCHFFSCRVRLIGSPTWFIFHFQFF